MTSVYPSPTYYGQQPPPGGGYDPTPPGAVQPPQGYYPPQAYYPPPGSAPPPGYGAPQQYAPPTGYAPPPAYALPPGYSPQPQQYAPMPGGAYPIPATSSGYPTHSYDNGAAVALPIAQQGFAMPPTKQEQDPVSRIETGRWAVGLCDCCNNCFPNLFMAWCCPCVSLAQVYARMAMGRYSAVLIRLLVLVLGGIILQFVMPSSKSSEETQGYFDENGMDQAPQASATSMVGSVGYLIIEVAFTLHVIHARMRVRQRFQIPGSSCCDCMISCCCSCCAIAQMATHVKSYTPGNCSFGAPDVLPAFN